MTIEECRTLVISVFEAYYRGVTLRADYIYSPNKIDEAALDKFLVFIEGEFNINSINVNWILDYVELSFHWWYQKTHLRFGLESIKLSWIIGKQSIDRWQNLRNRPGAAAFHRRTISSDIRSSIRSKFNTQGTASVGTRSDWLLGAKNDAEDKHKQMFYNKPEGLLWCRANTSLFNHRSELCEKCNNRLRCKTLLKTAMPKLYNRRGYNG